ncbi:unnamed protein product [Linum trigynum]|uniref:Integrase catalytic domain-containing protein n=1 Tax=Linum trigynum TaxID=586398 RepID=A0AAV2EDY9_9ROSI
MAQVVKAYVESCNTCQRVKLSHLRPAGLLQPMPVPERVWEDISMDFIVGLPPSGGKTVVFVVVDRLTKYAHFMPLWHPYTAKSVAEQFVLGVVRHHGFPRSIVSDRDPVFLSRFWQEVFAMAHTVLRMSSAYHPQTDGQTEIVNKHLEQYLRCFAHQQPKQWLAMLPWAKLWYNTTYHRAIKMTPFEALYGRPPPTLVQYRGGSSSVDAVDRCLGARDEALEQLQTNLAAANNRMKQAEDAGRRDEEFEVGDWVLLRLHPYRQSSVFRRAYQKLAARFFGPYEITHKVNPVAYRLQLPAGSRIHPVFHISLLKRYRGPADRVTSTAPPATADGDLEVVPLKVLDTRWTKKGGRLVEEILVQWKHVEPEDASWKSQRCSNRGFRISTSRPMSILKEEGMWET